MKKLLTLLLAAVSFASLFAAGKPYSPEIIWEGYKGGQAVVAPEVKTVKGPDSKTAARIEAVTKGRFQGASGTFTRTEDLSKYSAVEFYIRHNISQSRNGRMSMVFMLFGKNGSVHGTFVTPSSNWNKVSIPLDRTSFKAQRGNSVNLGGMQKLRIYPYGNMDKKGKFLEIADLKFIPKNSGTQKLKVMSYVHTAKPTSGEKGNTLTDGDKTKNVFFRQFSDDPFITFDLGGRFTIDEIKVTSNCAPSHNFAEIAIFASFDNKKFIPAGNLRNNADGTAVRQVTYSFKSERPIVGRYLRLKATRPRSDFPVELAEVEFFGHFPSAEEIDKAAEINYDTGVKMLPRNARDYAVYTAGDYKLFISRSNGVVNGVYYKGKLIVERMTPSYTLQTRKTDTPVDGNQDKVIDIKAADGKVYVTTRNALLPDLEFKRTWYVVENALFERVEIKNLGMKERKFLRIATGVILEQNFRSNGFYEMPATALAVGMFRLPASEIQMDRSLTNIPTIAFENAATRQVLWHTRYKFNDRFTYMDIGTEEENLQIFRPNGWLITSATIVPLDRKVHSFENRFSVTEGGMLKAYDEYISTPEAAAFRAQIKRPMWLRDIRCVVSQGWDGSYPGSSERHFKNMADAFSPRGVLYDGMMFDMDGHWGDLPTDRSVYGWFGSLTTPEELKAKIKRLRTYSPNYKLGYYTWFWSAFPWSTPVKNHPEWFVKTLRSGAPASWFPGVNVNYLRFFGIKESRDEAKNQIVDFINFYDQDGWYLDGGKSGTYAKCYDTMRIDDPLGQTDFYQSVRKSIKANDPDRIVFFNHSENPLGDMGFLESFGGTLTNEWRRGAILMWKFKMYAYKDPRHHSVYIYWLPGVDGAFHNYMTGIGVIGSYSSRGFNTRDLPFIAARYEIRQAQITDADVKPDWRMDTKEDVECMTLHQGNNGWIFINPHLAKPVKREISALTAPMNITDKNKPIYAWLYTIKDGKKYKACFSEKAIAKAYRETGWISERAVVPEYLGKFPYTDRFKVAVDLKDRAKVLMLTQIPAVVLSIGSEPSHYYLSGQPGIELKENNGKFIVNNEYSTAEIGLILEDKQVPATVKVNGKTVQASLRVENNMRFAVVPVSKGESIIEMTAAAEVPVKVESLIVKRHKRILSVHVKPANALVEVYSEGNLVMNRAGSFRMADMPDVVRDGVYTFKAGSQVKKLTIKKVGKPMKIRPVLVTLKDKVAIKAVNKTVRNIKVSQVGTVHSEGATQATADADKLKLSTAAHRIIESHFNRTGAMMEIEAKRYIKVKMDNGFWFFNVYGYQPKKHSVRYSRPNVFGGLIFDFNTPRGYTLRSAAGLGIQNEKRKTIQPKDWGKKAGHDHIYLLDNILISDKVKEKTCWIDLKSVGAPEDWNGKVIVSLFMEDINPNRKFSIELLETSDKLPAGATVLTPMEFGRKHNAVLEFKKIKGSKPNWSRIKPLGEMVPIKSTMEPLKTVVKAAWDDKNIYLYYEAWEIKGRILNSEGGKTGKPWWGDGVEFFFQRTNDPSMIYHALIDVGNVPYCEDMTMYRTVGGKNIIHPKPGFKSKYNIKSDRWTAEVVIPWSTIGGKPAKDKLVAFNMMRNRLEQGTAGNYTLAPGTQYFSGKQYQFKLVD